MDGSLHRPPGRSSEEAALVPWSRELLWREVRRGAFPAFVWVMFLPLFADFTGVPWAVGAPLGAAAVIGVVAAFERRNRDTTVVAILGTLAVLFSAMVLASIAAFLA